MKELKELGIDIYKASMLWYPQLKLDKNKKSYIDSYYLTTNNIVNNHFWNTGVGKETYPIFALQEILNILPKSLPYWKDGIFYELYISFYGDNIKISYEAVEEALAEYNYINYATKTKYYGKPLDAAFEMLKYLKKNNYI